MGTIEQRFKEIAYKQPKPNLFNSKNTPKSEDIVFLICDELKDNDFPEPFFNGVVPLSNGFKFFSYCGKDQRAKINKNALVIQKKLSKDNKIIYKVYLMDKEGFNIRELFLKFAGRDTIGEHNGFNLNPSHYISSVKEQYPKNELIYIINQIQNTLVDWSLNK